MSDSEEYEYDDDDMEEEQEEEQFEYTDDEEQADDGQVALENQYYNSKSLRDDPVEAAASFERVIQMEAESGQPNGPWTFKARKQLTKLFLRHGDVPATMQHYRQLLDGISQPNNNDSNNNSSASTVSPNAIEKGIHAMLERVASLYQTAAATGSSSSSHPSSSSSSSSSSSTSSPKDILDLALNVYDATLQVFHPHQGVCPNERLWFKTNLKYGQLLYEQNDTRKLQQVLQDLQSVHQVVDDNMDTTTTSGGGNASNSASSTQSLEIYALQMQLYSRQKENKKMRQVYQQAMQVRGSIPHPRTIAMIQELGGKNFMATKEYEAAEKTFFQAFKSYDEAGDIKRLRVLKYLVLASMLHASTINPFDSQEARPYRDDPEIVAMTNLVQAFHNNDINTFEKVVRQGRVMNDEFIRKYSTQDELL
jgi:COP9 signalosome complex subunit 2